jgi:predicted Zn-dependent peptidase
MKINSVVNSKIIQNKQNFKGSSAISSPFYNFPSYQSIPLETYKAYASPQVKTGYKEIRTFDVPNVGKGKLYELNNGHKVAIVKNNDSISIKTFVKGGSEDAPTTSHLLEHLVYRGENSINGKRFSELTAEIGAETNAATHGDYTEYFINYPFNNNDDIDKLIKIQSELLQNPSFNKEQFEKEKKIILIEYKGQELKNELKNKDAMFIDALLDSDRKTEKLDYSKEAIGKISFEEVMNFYNKNYTNNNMVSVVVGDVNPDEVIKSFSKYFDKQSANNSGKKMEPKLVLQNAKRIDLTNNLYFDSPVNIGFVGPKNNNLKDSFLAVALSIYIDELSKQQDNTKIKMSTVVNGNKAEDGLGLKFIISSQDENEKKINALNQYLQELTQKTFSEGDIKNIKTRLKDSNSLVTENSEKVASAIGESLICGRDENYLNMYNYIDNLTSKDLQDFIKKYINPEKQLTMVFTKPQLLTENKTISFKGSTPVNNINTKNIKEYNFPNNLQLIVDAAPEITRTTFSIELKHYKLPKDNIKTYVALEKMLKNKIEENNSTRKNNFNSIKWQSDLDVFKVSINSLPEKTIQSINLAKEIILNPNFTPNDLEKVKNGFKGSNDNIDEVLLLDVTNLYNKLISNSEGKAVLTVPQDVLNNQTNIISSISKDIPLLQVKQDKATQAKNNFKALDKTRVVIEKSYGDNTTIYQGFKFTNSDKVEDTIALSLLSQILGDGNNSRLYKDIRENQNLVYNITSRFGEKDKHSYFEVLTEAPIMASNSADLQKILNSYRNNIDKLITSPISEEELNQAKTLLKSKYMSKLEESSYSRNELLLQFSPTELKQLFNTIDKITPSYTQKIANKYLSSPSEILIKSKQEVIDNNQIYLENLTK